MSHHEEIRKGLVEYTLTKIIHAEEFGITLIKIPDPVMHFKRV